MGRMMTPKRMGTCRGSKRVPKVSPRAAHMMHANGNMVSRIGQWTVRLIWIALDVHHGGDREDESGRDQPLDGSGRHLTDGHHPHGQRGKDSILDLLRIAELLDHG